MDLLEDSSNPSLSSQNTFSLAPFMVEFRRPNNIPSSRRVSRRQQTNLGAATSPVLRSPITEQQTEPKEILKKTMARVWFERNAEKALHHIKKDDSAQRMKELRKHLDHIEETEWLYQSVDVLIGQY